MEDDKGLARLFQKRMHKHGYEVDVAHDGEQGLAMLNDRDYDVVAVDHKMPRRTGLEVIQALAARGPLPPTIMITGAGNEEVAVEAIKLGAVDYIIKDTDLRYLDQIPAVIEQAIHRKVKDKDRCGTEPAVPIGDEHCKQFVELSPDAIFMLVNDRIVFANMAAADILGVSCPDGLIGTGITEWIHQSGQDTIIEAMRRVPEKRRPCPILDTAFIRANGTIVDVEATAIPLTSDGSVLLVIRDISRRKKADVVDPSTDRLGAMADLTAGMVRNFSNLLQVLLGRAERALLNLDLGDYSEAQSNINSIVEYSCRGLDTLKCLRTFARPRSCAVATKGMVVDLSKSVSKVLRMSDVWRRVTPERNGLTINLVRDLSAGATIRGDEGEITRLVIALVRNAIEAMPLGGDLTVSTTVEGGYSILRVADSGMGIPEEYRGKIFQPFFTTKGSWRTGMGLATAYGIARAHGGTLTVQSTSGHGTECLARFPWFSVGPERIDPGSA